MDDENKTKQQLIQELNVAREQIAELKAAQQAIKADAATASALLEVLPDLMFRLSADGTHLEFYAPQMNQLFVQPKYFLGKIVDDVLPHEVATQYKTHIQRSLEAGQKQIFEYYLDFDGKGRVHYEAHMVRAGEDEVLVLVHDVTARKQTEEALRESESRNRALLNAITETAMLLMLDGKIITLNETAANDLEKLRNELIDMNIFEILPPDVAAHRRNQADQVARTGSPVHFEDSRAGRYFDNTVYPVFDARGNVTQVAVFARDVTANKQAEDQLRQAKLVAEVAAETAANAERQAQARLEETRGLLKAAQAILESSSVRDICQILISHFNSLVDADRTVIFLVNHEHREILLNMAVGNIESEVPMTYDELALGLSGTVFESGQPVLSLTLEDEPASTQKRRVQDNAGSLIVVPLTTKYSDGISTVIGSITAIRSVDQDSFVQHDVDLLMTLASQAATAIESVRAFEAAEQELVERKLAEEKLSASEARWRSLVENAPNILFEFDREGIIHFINFVDIGLSVEEVIGTSLFDYAHPEDHDRVKTYVEQVFQTGEPISYESRGVDGQWYSVRIGAIQQGSEVNNLMMILTNITELKQSEIALRQSEERLRQAMQIAHLGIWDWDIVTDVTHWYGDMFTIYGITPEEFTGVGSDYVDFTRDDYKQQQLDNIQVAFEKGVTEEQLREGISIEYQPRELCIVRPDGTEVYTLGDAISITDEAGNPIRMVGVSFDITERKQTEQILQARLRLVEQAITYSIDELMRSLLDEIEFLTKSQISFLHLVGSDQKTLTFQAFSTRTQDLCATEEQERHIKVDEAGVWTECIQKMHPVIHEDYASLPHRNGLPEGHIEVIRELLVPIIRNNLVVAIVGVGNKGIGYDDRDIEVVLQLANLGWDIVARKQAELELTKRDEILALKDRIISTVSHEFRTPLALINTSHDLLTRYGDRLTEQRKDELFEEIHMQVVALTELTDDMLSISRAQSGRTGFKPTLLNIEAFCQTIFDQIRFMDNEEHQFEFTSKLSEKTMMGDGKLLQRILTNLLNNAVKYSPENSRISLELEHDNSSIVLKISDEGIGIPAADQSQIFEPFHRASNVGSKSGTGMGLSIVKEYVDLHSGNIEVQSKSGTGTTFVVALPIE